MQGVQDEIIIAALEEMDQGQSIEKILARYAQHADELRPILETATDLHEVTAAPSSSARQASRQRFLAEAQRLRESAAVERPTTPWRRFFYSFASFAIFLVLLGVIIIPPSADAIPGDILYPVKRSAESVQLFLAPENERQALEEAFEEERNHEIYEMLDVGRDGRAGYVGIIEEINEDAWEIGHITALITEDTVITGTPEVGARVQAHCLVKDGQVIAQSLVILKPPDTMAPATP